MTEERKYPSSPDEHMLHMRHREKHIPIDASYSFEETGLLYQLSAAALRALALLVLPIWARFAVDYRIIGRENLRFLENRGAILIANHVHFLDAPIICSCLSQTRKIRYITLGENMDIPVAGPIIKALGGIPLPDSLGGMRSFRRVVDDLLGRGKWVLFMAEGALWPYYRGIRAFHKGGFSFAARNQVPVVPLVYTFEEGAFSRERMVLTIGKPIEPDGRTAEQLLEVTQHYFEETAAAFYRRHE